MLGTIYLDKPGRRRQIFTIFDPYPTTIGIPAIYLWRGFLILMYLWTFVTWGHPSQAWIYLLRIFTIPFSNLEMWLLFWIFRLIFFNHYSSYKSVSQIDYIYLCMLYTVSFQTLQIRKIWENETYFHYLSERLQLLHSCAVLNFPTFPKIFKLSELFRSLFFPNK